MYIYIHMYVYVYIQYTNVCVYVCVCLQTRMTQSTYDTYVSLYTCSLDVS